MTYELTLPYLPKTWNSFATKHWRYYKAYKDQIHKDIIFFGRKIHTPMSAVRINFIFGFSSKRRQDIDAMCTKPHVDAFVNLGIIPDDNRSVVREVRYTWEESKEPYTKIIIEEITNEHPEKIDKESYQRSRSSESKTAGSPTQE